jgi:cytochrome c-type biogenesis protein CcmE
MADENEDLSPSEAEPVAPSPELAPEPPAESGGPGLAIAPIAIGATLFAVVAGGVAWALLSDDSTDMWVHARKVDEVMSNSAEYVGQEVKVEGDLRQGSIERSVSPCAWRFVIERNGHSMPVLFPECVVPDTFRDGEGLIVNVQGTLGHDGTFTATQIVPRCPSKYEQQQRFQAGERIPHSLEAPSGES